MYLYLVPYEQVTDSEGFPANRHLSEFDKSCEGIILTCPGLPLFAGEPLLFFCGRAEMERGLECLRETSVREISR